MNCLNSSDPFSRKLFVDVDQKYIFSVYSKDLLRMCYDIRELEKYFNSTVHFKNVLTNTDFTDNELVSLYEFLVRFQSLYGPELNNFQKKIIEKYLYSITNHYIQYFNGNSQYALLNIIAQLPASTDINEVTIFVNKVCTKIDHPLFAVYPLYQKYREELRSTIIIAFLQNSKYENEKFEFLRYVLQDPVVATFRFTQSGSMSPEIVSKIDDIIHECTLLHLIAINTNFSEEQLVFLMKELVRQGADLTSTDHSAFQNFDGYNPYYDETEREPLFYAEHLDYDQFVRAYSRNYEYNIIVQRSEILESDLLDGQHLMSDEVVYRLNGRNDRLYRKSKLDQWDGFRLHKKDPLTNVPATKIEKGILKVIEDVPIPLNGGYRKSRKVTNTSTKYPFSNRTRRVPEA